MVACEGVTTGATVNNWQILSVDGNWFAGTTEAPACSFAGAFLNFGDMVGPPNTELRRSEY